jgi:hypothetical protein
VGKGEEEKRGRGAEGNTQHSTFNIQHSTFNVQRWGRAGQEGECKMKN